MLEVEFLGRNFLQRFIVRNVAVESTHRSHNLAFRV
jgi:hypothetical protein